MCGHVRSLRMQIGVLSRRLLRQTLVADLLAVNECFCVDAHCLAIERAYGFVYLSGALGMSMALAVPKLQAALPLSLP